MNEEEMLIYTSGAQPMVLDSVLDIERQFELPLDHS